MSALDAVAPGPMAATARIGGGAMLGPVAAELYHRLGRCTCTLGTCDSVGISGLLLGGGFGLMSREHGLTIDALASARVVLADGSVVETDASRNPDLFWAIRGGGGSFGIVTEMVLRTRSWRAVHGVTQHWTWTDAPRVLRIWSAWIDTLPPGTSSSLVWATSGTTTSSDIRTIVRSDRSADEAERCAASLSEALGAEPTRAKSRTSGPPAAKPELRLTGPRSANASAFARAEVDAPTAARIAAAMEERRAGGRRFGDGTTMMICNGLGGAVAKVPREATAFAHRDARFLAEFAAEWTTDTADANAANGAWVRTVSDAVRPTLGGGSYLNYADAGLVDWRRAYWGANLERLEAIKSRLDPTRSFGGRQSV
jgi:FAD/FMN-containing dehydrogenase